jgi:hypothetical protein
MWIRGRRPTRRAASRKRGKITTCRAGDVHRAG